MGIFDNCFNYYVDIYFIINSSVNQKVLISKVSYKWPL